MAAEITLKGLLARDEGETASELLCHEVAGLAELVLARLGDEVLGDELASRDSGDGDGTLDNGKDDLEITHMNTYN